MKTIRSAAAFTAILLVLSAASPATAQNPATAGPQESASQAGYPEAFFKAMPGTERFKDPAYFRTLAGDGIRTADPKALFGRISAAIEANEAYKALYLSRLFNELQPDNAIGWTNRAKLAASLGFSEEAAAAQANAESGSARPVPGGALPGAFKVRPTSLSDWAAALAMAGDDVTAREGRLVILAVRDDLSGIDVAPAEAVQRENRGPWATARPVQVEHVLPSLFAMPQAKPMDRKSIKGGLFALGAIALAGSTYSTSVGAADAATQFAELYGNAMAKAFEVPSEFKGGSYFAVTYKGSAPQRAELKPKTAGKHEAVGTPLPVLWASGPSLSSVVTAAWTNGDSSKTEAIKVDASTKKQEWKKHQISTLSYPRLHELCVAPNRCSPRLTLLELVLTADDLRAIAPGAETRLPSTDVFAASYAQGGPLTVTAAGERFAGFDAKGTVYITKQRPTEWLTSPVPVAAKK